MKKHKFLFASGLLLVSLSTAGCLITYLASQKDFPKLLKHKVLLGLTLFSAFVAISSIMYLIRLQRKGRASLINKPQQGHVSGASKTSLALAIIDNQPQEIELLLQNEQTDPNGMVCVYDERSCAAVYRDTRNSIYHSCYTTDPLTYYIRRPNESMREMTPLNLAILSRAIKPVQLLLRNKKIDPNFCDGTGYTPLGLAIESSNVAFVRLLLTHPKIDISIRTSRNNYMWSYRSFSGIRNSVDHAAMVAVSGEIVELLLDHARNKEIVFDWSNLFIAKNIEEYILEPTITLKKRLEVVNLHIKYGVLNYEVVGKIGRKAAISAIKNIACNNSREDYSEFLKFLVQNENLDVNFVKSNVYYFNDEYQDLFHNGGLVIAFAEVASAELFELLLKRKELNINCSNNRGDNCLTIALKNRRYDNVRMLLKHRFNDVRELVFSPGRIRLEPRRYDGSSYLESLCTAIDSDLFPEGRNIDVFIREEQISEENDYRDNCLKRVRGILTDEQIANLKGVREVILKYIELGIIDKLHNFIKAINIITAVRYDNAEYFKENVLPISAQNCIAEKSKKFYKFLERRLCGPLGRSFDIDRIGLLPEEVRVKIVSESLNNNFFDELSYCFYIVSIVLEVLERDFNENMFEEFADLLIFYQSKRFVDVKVRLKFIDESILKVILK